MRAANGRTARVRVVARLTGKSVGTIWRWAAQGCDLSSAASIDEFLQGNKLRQNANLIRDFATQNGDSQKPKRNPPAGAAPDDQPGAELGPIGRRGAAAALERLEEIEERAHARLIQAIEDGNQFAIKAAQGFYLRSSETLRRLDLAVETERRKADDQVPMWLVKDTSLQIATWLRTAFEQFLSSESSGLMAIADLGEFKSLAIERFRGILHKEVKASLKTDPPIPGWAETQIREAWNIL
jgi:hypothetical protein